MNGNRTLVSIDLIIDGPFTEQQKQDIDQAANDAIMRIEEVSQPGSFFKVVVGENVSYPRG